MSELRQVPVSGGEEYSAWNERMVQRYDIDRYYEKSHPLVRWVEARRLAGLKKLAAVQPTDRVLEVGCGAGHVLAQFPGADRTGIDLSPTMVEKAKRRLGPDVRVLQGSAETLPFDDGAFDVVLCTEVLEHVPDPRRVIAELVRVAGPNGRVVVSIPNEVIIDRVKRLLRRTPLVRSALRTLASEGNEWHLHHMDLGALDRFANGVARLQRRLAVPSRLMPLRWVVLMEAS